MMFFSGDVTVCSDLSWNIEDFIRWIKWFYCSRWKNSPKNWCQKRSLMMPVLYELVEFQVFKLIWVQNPHIYYIFCKFPSSTSRIFRALILLVHFVSDFGILCCLSMLHPSNDWPKHEFDSKWEWSNRREPRCLVTGYYCYQPIAT